jgi:hypothetical protein
VRTPATHQLAKESTRHISRAPEMLADEEPWTSDGVCGMEIGQQLDGPVHEPVRPPPRMELKPLLVRSELDERPVARSNRLAELGQNRRELGVMRDEEGRRHGPDAREQRAEQLGDSRPDAPLRKVAVEHLAEKGLTASGSLEPSGECLAALRPGLRLQDEHPLP